MPIPPPEKHEFRPRDRWLIASLVSGPLAALTHLTVSYSLVPSACAQGTRAMLLLSAFAFIAIALAGGAVAFRILKACDPVEGVLWVERTRWLATVASALAAASAVVIVAMSIPYLIHRICD